MAIEFQCLLCGHANSAPDERAGEAVNCSACGRTVKVPMPIGGKLTGKRIKVEAAKTSNRQAAPPAPAAAAAGPAARPTSQGSGVGVDAGLYRDGAMLVATLNRSIFPGRCVVTNQPTTGEKFYYREKITPQKAHTMAKYAASAAKGVAATAGVAAAAPLGVLAPVAILAAMDTVAFRIGLSEEIQDRYYTRKTRALWLIFGGLIAMFLLPTPLLYFEIENKPIPTWAYVACFAVMGLGLIAMLGGLIYFAAAVRQPIRIRTTDGTYVWFEGVHKDFLADLPEFPRG